MEKVIRDAGGCTDFVAIITYPNTKTQIPSRYSYTYTINGRVIHDEFDNVNPDEYNAKLNSSTASNNSTDSSKVNTTTNKNNNSNNGSQSSSNSSATVYWTQKERAIIQQKTVPH